MQLPPIRKCTIKVRYTDEVFWRRLLLKDTPENPISGTTKRCLPASPRQGLSKIRYIIVYIEFPNFRRNLGRFIQRRLGFESRLVVFDNI